MSAGAVLLGTAFAMVVIASATVAVSTRDARLAVIGLLGALLAAPFIAEPVPDLRGVTARLAGAALGAYPLWMIYRRSDATTAGSTGGPLIDGIVAVVAALVAAAAAVGWDVGAALGTAEGATLVGQLGDLAVSLQRPFVPPIAAGGALVVLAVSPTAFAREPLRLVLGLTTGLLGVTLVWTGLAGPPTPFTNLCIAITLAAVCAGGAVVVAASRRTSRPLPEAAGLRALPPLRLPHRTGRGVPATGGRTSRARPSGQLALDLPPPSAEALLDGGATAARVGDRGPGAGDGTPEELLGAAPATVGGEPGGAAVSGADSTDAATAPREASAGTDDETWPGGGDA